LYTSVLEILQLKDYVRHSSCLEEKKDLWKKCGRCCITYPTCVEYESEMTLASACML